MISFLVSWFFVYTVLSKGVGYLSL